MKYLFLASLICSTFVVFSQPQDDHQFFEKKSTVDFLISRFSEKWELIQMKKGSFNEELTKYPIAEYSEFTIALDPDYARDMKLSKSNSERLTGLFRDYTIYRNTLTDNHGNAVGYFCAAMPSNYNYRILFSRNGKVMMSAYLSENTGKLTLFYLSGNIYFAIGESCINGEGFEKVVRLLNTDD